MERQDVEHVTVETRLTEAAQKSLRVTTGAIASGKSTGKLYLTIRSAGIDRRDPSQRLEARDVMATIAAESIASRVWFGVF